MCGFVSHLNPFHIDMVVLQQLQDILCMFRQLILHFVVTQVLPCCRYMLFSRICPPITVMEVNHQSQTVVFRTLSHFENIIFSREAVTWIYPHPKSNGIHAEFFHQGSVFSYLTVFVV